MSTAEKETIQATMKVNLTLEELQLLDGKCRPEIQGSVDEAKEALSIAASGLVPREAAMVASIVAHARKEGRLTYSGVNVRSCPCCQRCDGYWPVKRATRYKRKGGLDYDKPKLFRAYDIARGIVTMQNHISTGFCDECKDRILPALRTALRGVAAEIPAVLLGSEPQYKRYDNRHCTKCEWHGHEGEMGKLRTLMGDGWYAGKCPKCGAENSLFTNVVKHEDGFALVENVKAGA